MLKGGLGGWLRAGFPTEPNRIIADALARGTYERRRHKQNGLALAIDLPRFCDPPTFRREVARLVTGCRERAAWPRS